MSSHTPRLPNMILFCKIIDDLITEICLVEIHSRRYDPSEDEVTAISWMAHNTNADLILGWIYPGIQEALNSREFEWSFPTISWMESAIEAGKRYLEDHPEKFAVNYEIIKDVYCDDFMKVLRKFYVAVPERVDDPNTMSSDKFFSATLKNVEKVFINSHWN